MINFEDQDFFPNFYQRLDIEIDADTIAVTRAYKKRAKETHPDINKDPTAEAQFVAVGRAYEILKDPATRRIYDSHLSSRGQNFSTDKTSQKTKTSTGSDKSESSGERHYNSKYTDPSFYKDFNYTFEDVQRYKEAAARMSMGLARSGDLSTVFNFVAGSAKSVRSLEGPSIVAEQDVLEDKRQSLLSRITGLLSFDKKN